MLVLAARLDLRGSELGVEVLEAFALPMGSIDKVRMPDRAKWARQANWLALPAP